MTSEVAVTAQSRAFRLAGFALAHAAWSIEDGAELVPIGVTQQEGKRTAMRFAIDITPERLPEFYAVIGRRTEAGRYGVLAFRSITPDEQGAPLEVLNLHVIDDTGECVGTVEQPYQPARTSKIPGRSIPFTAIGTPSPANDIDFPGVRERILVGAMSHPEGERLFPQLAWRAFDLIEATLTRRAPH